MDPEDTEAPSLNIEETSQEIAEDLHLVEPPEQEEEAAPAPEPKAGEKPGAAPQKPEAQPAQPSAPAAPSPAPDSPPDTWRKDAKEAWAALPPGIKDEIRKREGDITRYVTETKDAVNISKAFEKIVEPYIPFFQQNNIDPWKYTQSLIGTHMSLLYGSPEQKQAALSTLAAQAGYRLPYNPQQGQLQNDPGQQRINQLEAELRAMRQGVTSVTTAVQEARLAELEQAVLAFAKDEENHPFFDDVAEDIQRLIAQGAAPTLEDAYNIAVNANPVTRQKLVDAAIEKRSKNLGNLEKARAVKAAKAAQVNVQSTRRGGRAPEPVGSIDDTLREKLAEINARS